MSAAVQPIAIEQGATFLMTLFIKDSTGAAIDLTGHTFRGKIREKVNDVAAIASFTFDVLDQMVTATKGKVNVSLSATVTAGITLPNQEQAKRKPTVMLYDIESEISGGTVYRWLQGEAEISPEVTK